MKQNSYAAGTGVPTLMTVLLVLTLAVFSALTLTSGRADLALSRTNADTVTAYYAADGLAAQLYADFAKSDAPELDTVIHMTDTQSLRLHLMRSGGEVTVLAWQTIPVPPGNELPEEENTLPVWGGENEGG